MSQMLRRQLQRATDDTAEHFFDGLGEGIASRVYGRSMDQRPIVAYAGQFVYIERRQLSQPNPDDIYVLTTADFGNPEGLTGRADFDTLAEALDYAWMTEAGGDFGVAAIAYKGLLYIDQTPLDYATKEEFMAAWGK